MATKKNNAKGKLSNGMGSIRKRSNGSYEVRYTEGFDKITGKQIQRSRSFKTEKEANEFRIKTLHQINEGSYVAPNQMLLADWTDFYLTHYTSNLKDLTKKSYEERIKLHIVPYLGRVKLCKLTPIMVQEFVDELGRDTKERKALSPKTIKCIHGVLHKALSRAVALGYIQKNAADNCTLQTVDQPEIDPLTDDQTIKFLNAIRGHKFENVYWLALFTGLRQSEILGLTWDCIDWEKNILTIKRQLIRKRKCDFEKDKVRDDGFKYKLITVKNKRVRYICVPDEVMDMFRERKKEQLEQRKKAEDLWNEPFPNLVFENEYGRNLAHATVGKHFKKIVREIGLPRERFHNLRHNYTVAALESGTDITTVQANLGHATSNFTLRVYDHVTDKRRIESAKQISNRIKHLEAKNN